MLLGTPLGGNAEDACLSDKIECLRRFSCRLKMLHPHEAFYLLRAGSMAEHQSLLVYDGILRSTLEDIMNVRLDNKQWSQAIQPVKHGGLGIRSAVDVSLPAFISSCIQSGDLSHATSSVAGVVGLSSAKSLWLNRSGA